MRNSTYILLVLGFLALSNVSVSAQEQAYTPARGSAERKVILDAIRKEMGISEQFKVHRLMLKNRYAFFYGNSMAFVDETTKEETVEFDTIKALLHTSDGKSWKVVAIWALSKDESGKQVEAFAQQVKQTLKKADASELMGN